MNLPLSNSRVESHQSPSHQPVVLGKGMSKAATPACRQESGENFEIVSCLATEQPMLKLRDLPGLQSLRSFFSQPRHRRGQVVQSHVRCSAAEGA